jgi:hypothetical protein
MQSSGTAVHGATVSKCQSAYRDTRQGILREVDCASGFGMPSTVIGVMAASGPERPTRCGKTGDAPRPALDQDCLAAL